MGVYIKEMEKPKRCADCECADEDWWCKFDYNLSYANEKEQYEHCPLIEIVCCGECKHWDKAVNGHLNIDDHLCRRALRWTLNTDYCSDGERRAE